jgi:hypothetical protein
MSSLMRRTILVAVLGGGGYAAWTISQKRRALTPPPAPEWPPMAPTADAAAAGTAPRVVETAPAASAPEPAAFAEPEATAGPGDDRPASAAPSDDDAPPAGATWVRPVDDGCPDGYPVKANDKSGIYHVPGGRFYDRTRPERCYPRAEDAEADGYRAAKA